VKPLLDPLESFAEYFAHEQLGIVPAISKNAQYLGKKILFGSGDDLSIIPSENNPNSEVVGITAPTKFLGDRLKGIIANAPEHFRSASEIRLRDLHGNNLCLGGPIANEISRKILGLQGASPLVHEHFDRVHLRVPCMLDHAASTAAVSKGTFRTGGKGPIPVWHFRTPDGPLAPEVKAGRLMNDYLHIVSVPNVFSERAHDKGRRVTIVYGSHGAGTRALAHMLEMEKLMEDILERTKKMKAWYVIIPVDRVSKDGEIPLSLGSVPTVYKINGNFGRIAEIMSKEASDMDRG
jgi:hypothetical protein